MNKAKAIVFIMALINLILGAGYWYFSLYVVAALLLMLSIMLFMSVFMMHKSDKDLAKLQEELKRE